MASTIKVCDMWDSDVQENGMLRILKTRETTSNEPVPEPQSADEDTAPPPYTENAGPEGTLADTVGTHVAVTGPQFPVEKTLLYIQAYDSRRRPHQHRSISTASLALATPGLRLAKAAAPSPSR